MKPIIFIPGIEATKLVDTNSFGFDTVWDAFDTLGNSLVTKLTGPHIDQPLQLNPLYDVGTSVIVGRDTVASLPYQNTFVNLAKKISDPIFPFGYDWRLSNAVNGARLKDFVEYLKGKLQISSGFRFVTHSMGGLIFSCYLKQLGGDTAHIDKVILCAPPFMGSPYALIHMVKGSGGLQGFISKVLGQNDDIRKIVRTYPGLFEILPVYDGALRYTDDQSDCSLLDPARWQSNIANDDVNDIKSLFPARLQALANFRWNDHIDYNTLDAATRQKILVVAGIDAKNSNTLTFLHVDRSSNGLDNFIRLDQLNSPGSNLSGDGTVPQLSSTFFSNVLTTIGVPKDNIAEQLGDNIDFHGLFLRDSRVQNVLSRYFGDDLLATPGSDALKNLCYSAGGSLPVLNKLI